MRCYICQHDDFRYCSHMSAWYCFENVTVPLRGYIKTAISSYSIKMYQLLILAFPGIKHRYRKVLRRMKPETNSFQITSI